MDCPGQGSVITGVIFARFSLQTLSAKFTKCRVIAAFALMASFAGEVLISATSGVFAHKPPIGLENAKENGTDQIVVIVIVMVVVAMVVGVVSSPIWGAEHRHGRGDHHWHGDHGKNDNDGRVGAI